jgi:hypothetical protein
MKLKIDTIAKTIEINESVSLGKLIEEIKKLLPDWEEYSILVTSDIIYIDKQYPIFPQPFIYPQPYNPYPIFPNPIIQPIIY